MRRMKVRIALAAAALAWAAAPPRAALEPPAPRAPLTRRRPAGFADLALKCLHQEYPNHISHTLAADSDVRPPRALTPAFYGCFDWHSDVHGHWLLVRLLRLFPQAPFAAPARAALARTFTAANVAGEVAYLHDAGRASFERPYGLAWLLQLAAELRAWDDADGRAWSAALQPLEAEAAARIKAWVPKLHYPIRIGEHDQTAFSFGLIWDWAATARDESMRALLRDAATRFYQADRNCPLDYEPSGQDFLSPCLAEADFMRRALAPADFAALAQRIPAGDSPRPAGPAWLAPGVVTDRADPKLAHIDGLNLSRAWMLEGIAAALPAQDPRRLVLLRHAAQAHAAAALPQVTGEHYEGGHWLGTFAVYLTSRAGLPCTGRPERSAQGFLQLGDEVRDVLHPDREPDQAVADAQRRPHRGRQRCAGHDRRVLDQAFHAAETLGQREHVAALQRTARGASSPPRSTAVTMPP